MALPARPIQRKRIHSLSTPAAAWIAAALLVVATAGCSSNAAEPTGPFTIAPVVGTILLSPGSAGLATFLVTRDGQPAPGQTIAFTIVASSTGAQGATLGASSAASDATGRATVSVQAGLAADFRVEAQLGTVQAGLTVIVHGGASGSVLVSPFFPASSRSAASATTFEVRFYDGTFCANLDFDQLPEPARAPVTLSMLGETARFDFVSSGVVSAAAGEAFDAEGTLVATGCVDVLGSSLLSNGAVEVALPLNDAVPDPVGTFTVTSTFSFSPPLAAAAALAAPWAGLSDCPLDPAQLWLDCTVDALSPSSPDDPLDCIPSPTPGAEGALGDAIMAARGTMLVDGSGAATTCRGPRDAGAAVSLDAVAMGLFGSPIPAPVVALPAIAADAATILNEVRLVSTLTVAPGASAGSYALTHTLTNALFGTDGQVSIALASLGLPTLQAFPAGSTDDGLLVIGPHGFTLRLGTMARAAFGPLALAPRGLPGSVSAFVPALFALAHSPDGSVAGCTALDGAICPLVSQAAGCLMTACTAGLGALANQLTAAFDGADGTGIDLSLSGSAPLVAIPGDAVADRLATDGTAPADMALWSATLRTSLGSAQAAVPFVGVRN